MGAGNPKIKLSQQRWVDVFSAAGLPSVVEPKMPLWLRCHVPLCVAFESIAVAAMRRGGGASWEEALVVARGMRESYALIRGLGYSVYPAGKSWLTVSPCWLPAAMLWLLSRVRAFRELLAGGIGECRALIDVMSGAAGQSNQTIIVARIRAMKPARSPRPF
jgi:2-dehydropantoate 2-reductase